MPPLTPRANQKLAVILKLDKRGSRTKMEIKFRYHATVTGSLNLKLFLLETSFKDSKRAVKRDKTNHIEEIKSLLINKPKRKY